MESMNTNEFKTKIFNYAQEKDWKYLGNLPAIIDFYADWCGPCKIQSPILEKISKKYEGKINIFKIYNEKKRRTLFCLWNTKHPVPSLHPNEGQTFNEPGVITRGST